MIAGRLLAPAPGWVRRADVVVVGSGVAGVTAALSAHRARPDRNILLVTKSLLDDGSTRWAQGGIAAALGPGDSPGQHLTDTLTAGAGLCDPEAVRSLVTDGPAAVRRLIALGARFDADPGGVLELTREGGHLRRRIAHAGGDATGAEISRALLRALAEAGAGGDEGTGIDVIEHAMTIDLLRTEDGRAAGLTLHVIGEGQQDGVGAVHAPAVVLASGGLGQVFSATTNPPVSTGDGVAIALRAGARVADLEFVQFHPTVLWLGPGARGRQPLISEAVRGEGAVLTDGSGNRFMTGRHPLADLAPRDVVALAITRRLAERPGGIGDHVFLDARMIDRFADRFPTINASCAAAGIDPSKDPIPVAPAAHYQCGGVDTDLDGRSTVPGLYAVGEVARTGLHGANRLASNSLLEGLVMGQRAAEALIENHGLGKSVGEPVSAPPVTVADPAGRAVLQVQMSAHLGIGREPAGLGSVDFPDTWPAAAGEISRKSVEAANLALVARAVATAATVRTESRGCHVRLDHPQRKLGWAQPISLTLDDGVLTVADLRQAVAS
ncbi:MAG: L-aspartate oxidase [Streptosporangiaceae bacterium]